MMFGLPDNTLQKMRQVFDKYPEIYQVIIYGSRAIGNYREGSDIDITMFGDSISEEIHTKVWLDLDELDTPYLIDLSIYNHLTSTRLSQQIKRAGKLFYSKKKEPQI